MRKRQRREKPQIPLEPPKPEESAEAEEPKAVYSLDDIMNEFGGWSRPAPKAPQKPPEPPPRPAAPVPPPSPPEKKPEPAPAPQPEPEAPPPPAEPAPPPSRFQFVKLDINEDGRAQSVPLNDPPPAAPPVAPPSRKPPEPSKAPPAAPRKKEPAPQKAERRDAPKKRNPKDVYKSLCKQFKGLRLRFRLSFLWAALSVLFTVLCHWKIPLGGFVFPVIPTGRLLIGLLFAGVFTAWDVMFGGVYRILQLRPDLDTLLVFCAVVFTVDGFAQIASGTRLPYAAVLLCALCFAMWGRVLKNRAQRRSLKVVLGLSGQPTAAVRSERAWGNRDCVFRSKGEPERFLEDLDVPSVVDQAMGIYVPSALALSLVFSLLMHFLRDRNFLLCWSLMLAASVPMAAFVTWWRPFASLAVRLAGGGSNGGAALCGWRGVQELYAPCCLAATDRDLFPEGNVKINGIKIFGGRSISQLSGYVLAVVAQSGSGLTPVFQEVYLNQNGIPCRTDFFRRYEGGGLGGSIQGDQVLVGSIAFMRAMGVRMEEGTNLRQAVYCAVNNELAAVFALKYVPSPMVRAGLNTVFHAKRLTLLLTTRDFILTPDVVFRKYKIPSTSMEFPSTEERARLSGPYAAHGGVQTALLGRDSFFLLAESIAGAQSLCGGVRAGLVVNLLGGCIGLLIGALLAWAGAFASASAAYLMLFSLLWTLPSMVLSVASGK